MIILRHGILEQGKGDFFPVVWELDTTITSEEPFNIAFVPQGIGGAVWSYQPNGVDASCVFIDVSTSFYTASNSAFKTFTYGRDWGVSVWSKNTQGNGISHILTWVFNTNDNPGAAGKAIGAWVDTEVIGAKLKYKIFGSGTQEIDIDDEYSAGSWNNTIISWNHDSSSFYAWENGVSVAETSLAFGPPTVSGDMNRFGIHANTWGATWISSLDDDTYYDKVKVFNRTLTNSDASTLWNGGSG